jgi:hypothetical protein
MTSKLSSYSNSDGDSATGLDEELTEEKLVTTEETPSPHKETHEIRLEIPEPDAENITVLTDKLPNTPILPWNRYDSPWEDTEEAKIASDNSHNEEQEEQSLAEETRQNEET